MIDELTAQKIKDSASIVEVIGDFCDLRKDGTGYTCLCPFHEDRHLGSFKVSPRRNMYKCFSCGKAGDPVAFLMDHEGLRYEQALRWLAQKYTIEVADDDKTRYYKGKTCQPHKPLPKLPLLVLDKEKYMRPTLDKDNNLTRWMKGLPWTEAQRERLPKVLRSYFVGTGKEGHAIFWQIDDKCQCRTGKMMLYRTDGHRDKETRGNFNFIHSMLWKAGIEDSEKAERELCIYGLHLINYKPDTVSIVESEKTALICSTVYGNIKHNLWLALGGLSYLTKEHLQPIIDRNIPIVLYPDMDGIEQWKAKAKEIGYKHLTVADKWMKDHWKPEDGEKADIADILIRMMKPTMEKVLEQYPVIRPLVEKLDCELISVKKI